MNTLTLNEVLESAEFLNQPSPFAFVLGANSEKNVAYANLADLPHLIIAGATGTGKSTFAHNIVLSISRKASPQNVRFLLCDTKLLEFSQYRGLPHLLIPPATDLQKIQGSILWAETELNRRLMLFRERGCRSIGDYNDFQWEQFDKELPRIVLVIDDASSVIQDSAIKSAIKNISQNGRAAGFHLILVTQSPNSFADIIKSHIPARAVFNVLTKKDEKLLLDSVQKEIFPEIGTMVFYDAPAHRKESIQCFSVSDFTISSVVADARERYQAFDSSSNMIDPDIFKEGQQELQSVGEEDKGDEMLPAAVEVILETGQASVSMLQRQLKLGYARAAKIMDEMEEKGIVGPLKGSTPRSILISKEQWSARGSSNYRIDFDVLDEYDSATDDRNDYDQEASDDFNTNKLGLFQKIKGLFSR